MNSILGATRRPTAPKLEALDAGLHLLVATGGGDPAIKQQLLDLKNAVVHNTKIAAEVDKRIAELSGLEKRESAVVASQHDVDRKLEKLATDTSANKLLISEAGEKLKLLADLEARAANLSERESVTAAKLEKLRAAFDAYGSDI